MVATPLQVVSLCLLVGLCWSIPQNDQIILVHSPGMISPFAVQVNHLTISVGEKVITPTDLVALLVRKLLEKPTSIFPFKSCNYDLYGCVPYFQCIDGYINTDGAGLIDVRIQTMLGLFSSNKKTVQCSNLEQPDTLAVCCLLPPTDICYDGTDCIDHHLCSANGVIVSNVTGIIDIRTKLPSCYLNNDEVGVCCKPDPPILDTCPYDSVCTDYTGCGLGKALGLSNSFLDYVTTGSWQECYLPHGNVGICCQQPAILDICPGKSLCVPHDSCDGRALSGPNNFIRYVQNEGAWSQCNYEFGGTGVCCKPKPILKCPHGSECIYGNECKGTSLNHGNNFVDYIDTGSWTTCKIRGAKNGVCCVQPTQYVTCHTDSVCTDFEKCVGDALDWDDVFVTYDPIGVYAECDYAGKAGVCCKKSLRTEPIAPKCGIRNYSLDQRILAYNEANFGEFPWQAIIFFKNYTFKCGASLISDRHVLTEAQCVYQYAPEAIKIRFGEWAINKYNEPLPYFDVDVRKIHVHNDFIPQNLHNDIALLELYEPIPLAYHINSVCIPPPDLAPSSGYRCFVSGWGKDSFQGQFQSILKKIDLPLVYHDQCQTLLRRTRLGRRFKLDPSFVCAGGEENKDACLGDGGGPLVCKDPASQQYFLHGITSWGIGCGSKDIPGVYVNVAYFYNWITNIVIGGVWDPNRDIRS